MGRRKKEKKKQHPTAAHEPGKNRLWDKIISALFLLGLVLIYWEVTLFRKTLIDLWIPLTMLLLPGIFLTPIFYRFMNEVDGRIGHWMLHYVLHTVIVGGAWIFCFVGVNYYAAEKKQNLETFSILDKGSLAGGKRSRSEREPYAIIDYHGLEKQLVFKHEFMDEMETANQVVLTTRKGLFGFTILDKYELR